MPSLRPEQLEAQLSATPAPAYLLHGSAPLLVEEAADMIRAAVRRAGASEREVLVASQGFKWEQLSMAAGNLSLFGERKLIDLRIPSGKPGKEGGESLRRVIESLQPGGDTLLITLPELDWAARKAAWFTALGKLATCLELNTPERSRMPAWVAARLERQQQAAEPQALEFIVDHVEGNLLAAHQEISKLALLHPAGTLSLAQVRDAVLSVARYDVDGLRMAMLDGDASRCTRLLNGLRGEGEAPPLILWALTTDLRALLRLRAASEKGQPLAAAFKAERVFDNSRRKAMQSTLSRVASGQLQAALSQAARIDRIVKGIARGEVWDELLQLMLKLRLRR